MSNEETREYLDETLKASNDAIMETVDNYLPIHNRLTLENDTDKVVKISDLEDLIFRCAVKDPLGYGQLLESELCKGLKL